MCCTNTYALSPDVSFDTVLGCVYNQKEMKAIELKKESEVIENIYNAISEANSRGHYKHFIPHFVCVSDFVVMQLITDGFKVYRGDWDGVMTNCTIIEW